jgi:hypothetical protein
MAEEALQVWTKIIARSVRNALESIHARNISDDLMPNINRACRRGIYLGGLTHSSHAWSSSSSIGRHKS